ncbi:MAG: penicillin-binding protein 2 [Pseudomonadota bacterium]
MDDARERERHARFSRRALVLLGGQLAVGGVLGWRLWQLQVLEGEAYLNLAEENRVNLQPVAPERGEIFDRAGRPIAVNLPNYTLKLIRERTDSTEATFARLRKLIDLTPREERIALSRLRRTRGFVPIPLKENLSWEAFSRINANAPSLPGVVPEATWTRFYPEADGLVHVVGYVAAVTDAEIERDRSNDPILRLPNARIGKNGIEKSAERNLRGAAGARRVEVNAAGREIRELSRDEGRRGDDLTLTIDLDLQRYAMERLKGESAAAVVMDVITGDIVALASTPGYDPNKFVFGISTTDWNALRADDHDPLRNKALAGAYPPGSTFKMMTALAGLETGLVGPSQSWFCGGKMRLGRRDFHCWKRGGHGSMNLKSGLKYSCDVYFYEVAKKVGIRKLAELCGRFGLGEAPEIEAPNVKAGNMPTPEWMLAARGERWSGGETLNVGIGQGAVLSTPLQLAVMTARLANGREQVSPRLIKGRNGVDVPVKPFAPLGVDPRNLAKIHDAMNAVSNEAGGTAFRSQIFDDDWRIAGKTGTAQVRRITVAERAVRVRKNEELPWHLRDHALFVAYGPVQAPRYAIGVVVEHGGSGSKAAAPVARDILLRAFFRGEPPLEAYPPWIRPEIEAARKAAEQARLSTDPAGALRGQAL